MIGICSDQTSSLARGDVRCYASGQGRRGPRKSGNSNHSNSRKQKGRKSGAAPASSTAVSKMSAAAKAAAKQASILSQQRFNRAVGATLSPSSSSSSSSIRDRLARTASSYTEDDADEDDDGYESEDATDANCNLLLCQPYLNTIVGHLRQTGSLSSTGNTIGTSSTGGTSSSIISTGSTTSRRGRGAKRGAVRSLLECHTAVFQAALDLELQEEWTEAEGRLKSWPLTRLAAEGVAMFNLAAAPAGGVFRDVLLKFFVPNKPLPFHSFSQGDILLVSRGDPLGDAYEAVVVDYSGRWIRLALNPTTAAAVAAAGRITAWRLDLFANTVSHERCSEALKRFAGAAAGRQQQQQSGLVSQQVVQQQEALWRVLAGVMPQGQHIAAAAAVSPPWVKSAHGRDRLAAVRAKVKGLVSTNQLNASQAKAVEAAITRTCTLWQGPPGTGKTTTLLRFCEAAVHLLAPSGGQLLAVAASNVAVDNLVAGLLALGLKVVRIGQPVKVAPELRSASLAVLAAATVAGQAAAKLRQQLVTAAAASRGSSKQRGSSSSSGGQAMWEQMLALEAAAAAEVLGSVQVVAATCVGAGDPVICERGFELVVLDEATQATEPAALVATAARAQALVMVGDPKQLPPTIKCRAAEQLGLGISMFDRLQAMGLQPFLLDVQYRMHPAICEFPAQHFYGGVLQSWPQPQDRPLPEGLRWPNPQVPVMFIQCNGPESRTRASISIYRQPETTASTDSEEDGYNRSSADGGGGYSYYNEAEAAAVFNCLEQLLLRGGMDASDVCVISPYSGQVRAIQQLLLRHTSSNSSDRSSVVDSQPRSSRIHNNRTSSKGDTSSSSSLIQESVQGNPSSSSRSGAVKLTGQLLSGLEVKSVDAFQGREKEVVIFSAVRSNATGRVGFLSDARRLNVALTRARRGLVVVGDARTLRADRVWASWLAWAQRQGVIVGHD